MRTVRKTMLAVMLAGVALSGCSWVKEWPPKDGPAAPSPDKQATAPQSRLMQTPDATWLAPADPKAPPVEHMVPRNGQSAEALTRINELEEEVASLRNEMSMMLPAMTKLAETQSALRDAVASTAEQAAAVAPAAGGPAPYEPLPLYNNSAAATDMNAAYVPPQVVAPVTAPVMAPAPTPVAMPVVAPGPAIGDIRFGDNNGRTRMVLDAGHAPEFSWTMDPATGILTVRLPGSGWGAVPAAAVQAPLAASYNAAPDGAGGTILTVQLTGAARVEMAQSLPPGGGKGHRVVIDLAPL